MEEKEIKINVPDGYEIDKENSTFECIKLKPIKKGLPKTWEEFCKIHPRRQGESWISDESQINSVNDSQYNHRGCIDDRNLLPNKKYAEAMLALCQLIQLRDCYNNGWIPDWDDKDDKFSIVFDSNCAKASSNINLQRVLTFESSKLRNEFLENFKDLIEIAKPLL